MIKLRQSATSTAQACHPGGTAPIPQSYHFGEFELDLNSLQLRKGETVIRLERRPFDLLVMLVQRRAGVVSREEIIAALWPENVIIDFDSGVNTLVRKIRNALGDSPDEPRFVETVPGRGYRFIAEVQQPATVARVEPQPAASPSKSRFWLGGALALIALISIGLLATWLSTRHETDPIRIAILPFENLTGDESLRYMALGLAEDINTSLAQVDLPNLRVIGVVSARAISASDLPLRTIGEQLGIDYLVVSSLRRDGPRIRVTSRLIRVADNEQLWSASFDRELTNLLGLQKELSVAIAEQVRLSLSPSVAAAIDARQTDNRQAYEMYLKGRYEWTRFQPDSISRALDWYRQAVEEDAEYALAWAGIAHALVTSVVTVEADPEQVRPAARDALEHALQYGPGLAETQLALASYYFFLEQDLANAELAARNAIALDRNSAMSHMFLGLMLSENGKHIEARAMLHRARNLDPLFPLIFANSALAALVADEPEEALELATQAVAINPEFWVGHLHLGSAQVALGNYDGALQSFTTAEKLSGNNSDRAASARAYVLAVLGRDEEARDILERLLTHPDGKSASPYYIAIAHAALGETDEAIDWLDRGLARNNQYCHDLERNRMLDSLRSDLRFENLLVQCKRSVKTQFRDFTTSDGTPP